MPVMPLLNVTSKFYHANEKCETSYQCNGYR